MNHQRTHREIRIIPFMILDSDTKNKGDDNDIRVKHSNIYIQIENWLDYLCLSILKHVQQ